MDPMSLMLLVLLGAMLIFMVFNSRKQAKKRREAEEERQTKMVPGARVMSRAGVFGTLVEFDPADLNTPARVEIADGVVVDMHAQSIDIAPEPPAAESVEDAEAEDTDGTVEVEHEQGTYTVNGEGVEKLPGSDDDDKK
ncbi:preprotein translocase subunit YajC [Microbacterium halophytorum]|uniref:preprotein translocase subunit YajC n=1 Tax=Microbacterium halophytorum TaxID=2067568 RepID=UPI000CFBE020|nr:preprotein translocase subunit YajC [Microbacterium halophytorum]